jgi:hypothetical protein
MKKQGKGFALVEPMLLVFLLTNFKVTNVTLGSLMIGLSVIALLCNSARVSRVAP